MKLIGVTGPAGSGKDKISNLIVERYGFSHVSGGDTLRSMLRKIDLASEKNSVVGFADFLRKNYGAAVIVEQALKANSSYEKIVYSGFRSPGETKAIHANGGVIVYIDASFETRLARIQQRNRPGEDTSEEAVRDREAFEYEGAEDHQENLDQVRKLADFIIFNDCSLEELDQKIIEVMSAIAVRMSWNLSETGLNSPQSN